MWIKHKVHEYYLIQCTCKYTLEIPKGQSKMDNPEKRPTSGIQDEEKQNKDSIQYVLNTTIRKQTQTT